MCERIRSTFGFFSPLFSFFHVFFFFIFLCTWKNWKCIFLATTLWGSTKLAMWILELIQNEGASMLSTMSSIHSISSILTEFEQQRFLKNSEKNKQRNEQPWTLAYTLVLQIMSSPLSSFKNPDQLVSLQNNVMEVKSQLDLSWSLTLV